LAAPCFGQFPDLAWRPAELPAERADEGGVAAELKIDGKIDQAFALPCRRNEQPQGAIEPLLLHVARKSAIGTEQSVQAGTGNAKAAAKIIGGERAGLDIGFDYGA
jgi:hypothetical protein